MQENIGSNPLNQSVSNSTPVIEQPLPARAGKQPSFLVILLYILLIIAVIIAGFFAFQTQKLVKELTALKSEEKVVAVASVEPTIEPLFESVKLDNLKNGDLISSPVEIIGKISRDWTFESTFSIEILDSNKKSLNTVPVGVIFEGEQTQMGSFSVMVPFTTNTDNGFVVVHADNPSGRPENDRSVEFTIKFNN